MKNGGKYVGMLLTGMVLGGILCGGAVAAGVVAEPTWQPIYVDGQQVSMTAYNIGGNNFVKLRDIGRQVGFNVYWDSGIRVDSQSPYTGNPPKIEVEPDVTMEAMDMDTVRDEMIQRINQVRRENGVAALKVDQNLMDAAQECSEMQITWHDNRKECETVAASGYPHGFGSNLTVFTGAVMDDIAVRAVENWVNFPGHFGTMINPACDSLGVGVTDDGVRIFCYMFVGIPNSNNPYA